jgi:hypothetical protein
MLQRPPPATLDVTITRCHSGVLVSKITDEARYVDQGDAHAYILSPKCNMTPVKQSPSKPSSVRPP